MHYVRAFLLAVQLLTRVPVPSNSTADDRDFGRSACAYPVVGLLLGCLLLVLTLGLRDADSDLLAALIVVLMAGITGALHLDGLADTLDAYLGGHGDRARTLAIMKDTAMGVAGVCSIVLVLMLKYAALSALIDHDLWTAVFVFPCIGRMAMLSLLLGAPYIRDRGLGCTIADTLPKASGWWSLLGSALLLAAVAGALGLLALVVGALTVWLLRASFMARLGGITGDTLGASCEISETLVLVATALVFASPAN